MESKIWDRQDVAEWSGTRSYGCYHPLMEAAFEKSRKTLHASVRTRVGLATIRDLDPRDLDSIVRFWYGSGDEFLDFLGIDRAQLGTEDDTRNRFLRAMPGNDPEPQSLAFAITLDGQFCGYTLLNRYTSETNYSHWHITNPSLRASGLSTALYPYRIKAYFDLVPIDRLIHQTRTRNVAVNRMLDKYVPVSETRYVENPDGVALPGEFHLRYVLRNDVARLFDKIESTHLSSSS